MTTLSAPLAAATSLVAEYGYPVLEANSAGMEVANVSTSVENNDWVLIVDAVILVRISSLPLQVIEGVRCIRCMELTLFSLLRSLGR